jgi:hypothetical protein
MNENRAKRRKAQKETDLGPDRDPIRQQGRDPLHVYIAVDWYETRQKKDRSLLARRQRKYHASYQTTSGHTHDQHWEVLARIAAEFENAGINLGWGGCRSQHCEVTVEVSRRYSGGPANHFQQQARSKSPRPR